ncbi:hypothetical protein [Abyssogena phaseoliformis symbiont]|uniref:hypothetical protein n=1 Tax=Abyssogena phaseoliformis symbiont TaxID=596095 RepID=UPI001CECB8B5|nr:hypothetical protein [Abyssogena phaseoliformis symbiont]
MLIFLSHGPLQGLRAINLMRRLYNKARLKKCGTRIVYVTVDINPESDEGFILDSVSEMMDELYSRQVSKDTKRSLLLTTP